MERVRNQLIRTALADHRNISSIFDVIRAAPERFAPTPNMRIEMWAIQRNGLADTVCIMPLQDRLHTWFTHVERLNPLRYQIGFGRGKTGASPWNKDAWMQRKWSKFNWRWLWKRRYVAFGNAHDPASNISHPELRKSAFPPAAFAASTASLSRNVMLAASHAENAISRSGETYDICGAKASQPMTQITDSRDREAAADIWRDYVARVGEIIVEKQQPRRSDYGLPTRLAEHRTQSTTAMSAEERLKSTANDLR